MIDPTSGRVLTSLTDKVGECRSAGEGEGDGHVLTHGPGEGPLSQLDRPPRRFGEKWQRYLTEFARMLEFIQENTLPGDLLEPGELPDSQVRKAMRAFGLEPGDDDVDTCRQRLQAMADPDYDPDYDPDFEPDSDSQPHPLQLDADRFLQMPYSMQTTVAIRAGVAKRLKGPITAVNSLFGLKLQSSRVASDFGPRLQLHRDLLARYPEVPEGSWKHRARLQLRRLIYTVEEHWTPQTSITAVDAALGRERARPLEGFIQKALRTTGTEYNHTASTWNQMSDWVKGEEAFLDTQGPWLPENAGMLDRFTEFLPEVDRDAGREAVRRWMRVLEQGMESVETINPVDVVLRIAPGPSAAEAEARFLRAARRAVQAEPTVTPLSAVELQHLRAFFQMMRTP